MVSRFPSIAPTRSPQNTLGHVQKPEVRVTKVNRGSKTSPGKSVPKIGQNVSTSQHAVLCHHRPNRKTTFRWRFAGEPMMARLPTYLPYRRKDGVGL